MPVLHLTDLAVYTDMKARHTTYETARERQYPGCCSFTQEMLATLPPGLTNDERSAIEEYEFRNGQPTRYVAYVNKRERLITTWTGQVLGRIRKITGGYRSNFGDTRIIYDVLGVNRVVYSATYYESAGDYCRMRARVAKGSIVVVPR